MQIDRITLILAMQAVNVALAGCILAIFGVVGGGDGPFANFFGDKDRINKGL